MKCPNCGYEPAKGRPKKLDDKKVKALSKSGKSLADIAKKFGVTRGAVQASLKRKVR
jgi:transposase